MVRRLRDGILFCSRAAAPPNPRAGANGHTSEFRAVGIVWISWRGATRTAAPAAVAADKIGSLAAILLLCTMAVQTWMAVEPGDAATEAALAKAVGAGPQAGLGQETYVAGYAGVPIYNRSDVKLVRPDGTDLTLKQLGWDGDALYFPIDGGVRSVQWSNSYAPFGFMVDFLHNKAISRLGKGAHGRKLKDPVIEEVDATGTLKGQPAAPRIKLTNVFERFEFTHGHNMLFFTPMLRLANITPALRPYVGAGAGFALPHVEVWHPGESQRTNEYQLAGPAVQFVAGLEFRSGKVSYFIEYKFSWASISGALTGDKSWLNFNMPGDLWRQASRWWRGEAPQYGTFSTELTAHQIVGGAGYWFAKKAPAAP
ncbi:MAG: lipid A oxidase [Hyphomicrobiaceae bacterium]